MLKRRRPPSRLEDLKAKPSGTIYRLKSATSGNVANNTSKCLAIQDTSNYGSRTIGQNRIDLNSRTMYNTRLGSAG